MTESFASFTTARNIPHKQLSCAALLASTVLALCFALGFCLPQAAWAQGAPYVRDDADLVSEEYQQVLEEQAAALSDEYGVGVYVITTPESADDEISSFAKDYYVKNDLGLGENNDGIMFIVATGDRSYIIKTKGAGRELVPDSQAQDIDDDVVTYLKQDDYAGAFTAYLADAEAALGDDVKGMPEQKKKLLIALGIGLVLGLLAAGATCLYFYSQMGTAKERTEANEYVNAETFMLSVQNDVYLRTDHIRVKRETDSGSSGGGGGGGFGGSSGGHY